MLEKIFKLKQHNTDVKTEVIAGITTFLAMAYILAVNPAMLADAGMDAGAVFTATALSAAIATFFMGFFANYPIALASGMGLNAYFAYTVSLGMGLGEDAWKIALAAVLVEGIIFIILSFFKFREKILNQIPTNLKYGITVGIGLFITIIGLIGAGIIKDDPATLVALGDLKSIQTILSIIGIISIAVLMHFKVKGAILIGILITWGLGIATEVTGFYVVNADMGVFSNIPDFSNYTLFPSMAPTFMQFDFKWASENIVSFATIVFAFLFVDLFDTVGTLIGVAAKGDLLDKEGKLPNAGQALMADAVGTVVGACFGTSTVTSYVESSAGVSAGGRTGLSAVVSGILFLLALFFSPVFLSIQGYATAPALIIVGLLMISAISKMDFEKDMADSISGFLAIVMMPFTYSIANGIMFGMLSWVIIKTIIGKHKDVSVTMWICAALFMAKILFL